MPPLPLPKRGRGCPRGSGKAKALVKVKTTSKKAKPASKKTTASPASKKTVLPAKLEVAKCSEHKFFLTFHDVPLTTFLDVILYILRALSDNARKRVAVLKSDDFEMMCHSIYTTLECQDTLVKPELAFKLPNMTKSSSTTCLQTEEEWQDLIKAIEQVEAKGGDLAANIVITEKVWHNCYSKSMILTLS